MEPCIHHLLNAAFALHDSNPTTLVQTPNDDKRATNKGFNNDVISFFKSQYPHTNFSKWSPYNCSKNKWRQLDKRSKPLVSILYKTNITQ